MRRFWIYFIECFFLLTLYTATTTRQEVESVKNLNFKLVTGDLMPLVGFGTYLIRGDDLIKSTLDYALDAGYRLIDSAAVYYNEESIGKALKVLLPKHNLTRKDIFITSKLSPEYHGERAYEALEKSLRNLDCEYIDLYLIHWPGVGPTKSRDKNESVLRDASWGQLVKGVRNGLTRNIGVSNYNVHHMRELLNNNHGIKPAVNQVEWHPYYHQPELLDLLQKEGILLQTYSSLGGTGNPDLLNNTQVVEIADKLKKTPAQVLLRWALQQNLGIIPKARSKKHIDENIELDFEISLEDMNKLSAFEQIKKYGWNPDHI